MAWSDIRRVQVYVPERIGGAADAVSSVIDLSADFSGPVFDFPNLEEEVVEEDYPSDLRD